MKRVVSILVLAVGVYLTSWSAAYFWIVGSDLEHYGEYLRLAWTNPGEIPAFLQMISIIATVLMLFIFWFLRNKLSISLNDSRE